MSLEQMAWLAQIVAAFGVLGSGFFVGVQIRQNTRYQKLSAVDALSTAMACLNAPGMETPALGEALVVASKDWWAANREQRILAHYYLFSYFKLAENAWYQREDGAIEAGQWFGWSNMVRMYSHSRGVQEVCGHDDTTLTLGPSRPFLPVRLRRTTSPLCTTFCAIGRPSRRKKPDSPWETAFLAGEARLKWCRPDGGGGTLYRPISKRCEFAKVIA
jgi:hypothetical protein